MSLEAIPRICAALREADADLLELRVGRARWIFSIGQLESARVASAKQYCHRRLDRLLKPNLVAIGVWKAGLAPMNEELAWKSEIHLIVAGATADELERGFSTKKVGDYVFVRRVERLAACVAKVLTSDLRWSHPWQPGMPREHVTLNQRREYDAFASERSDLGFHHGCRKSFALEPRRLVTIRPKRVSRKPTLRQALRLKSYLRRYQKNYDPDDDMDLIR